MIDQEKMNNSIRLMENAFFESGDFKEAKYYAREILETDINNAHAWIIKGIAEICESIDNITSGYSNIKTGVKLMSDEDRLINLNKFMEKYFLILFSYEKVLHKNTISHLKDEEYCIKAREYKVKFLNYVNEAFNDFDLTLNYEYLSHRKYEIFEEFYQESNNFIQKYCDEKEQYNLYHFFPYSDLSELKAIYTNVFIVSSNIGQVLYSAEDCVKAKRRMKYISNRCTPEYFYTDRKGDGKVKNNPELIKLIHDLTDKTMEELNHVENVLSFKFQKKQKDLRHIRREENKTYWSKYPSEYRQYYDVYQNVKSKIESTKQAIYEENKKDLTKDLGDQLGLQSQYDELLKMNKQYDELSSIHFKKRALILADIEAQKNLIDRTESKYQEALKESKTIKENNIRKLNDDMDKLKNDLLLVEKILYREI